ncbi:hypothetical protein JOQ06_024757 [Pogonophryne albipinna]|uniref:Ig-like domain-containing protein n=1 Tax=Pogonophryne albipinna TaxID=1090488 RepID=A0AAD6ADC7_9TELE|nr:hypothetical protein JOQ06_024757 [Pogonophryne albipinna]
MKLSPEALTVLRGDDARFTCSPSKTKWTVMVWLLDGTPVLTISKEFGVLPSVHSNVTAEKGSVSSGDSWVFVLKNTERRNQGQLTCELQGSDRRTASLFVQASDILLERSHKSTAAWLPLHAIVNTPCFNCPMYQSAMIAQSCSSVNANEARQPLPNSSEFTLPRVGRYDVYDTKIRHQIKAPGEKGQPIMQKGSVKVIGDSMLVFKGQSVLFGCHAAGWYPLPTLQWHVNNKTVSRGDYNISSEESGESLFTVSSNLSVTAAKSSYVDCLASVSALRTPLRSSFRLTVVAEVVQLEEGCTVPLAAMASLSAILLLLLLCICTVLCYRHRRQAKQSPQEAAIRFGQSVSGRSLVAEATGGKVNLGYSSEGPTDPAYSELNLETRRQQQDFVSFLKVPDVVSSSSRSLHDDSQAQVCLSEETAKNIRRITTV